MAYARNRYQQTSPGNFQLTPQEEARRYNEAAAARNYQINAQRRAEIEAEEIRSLEVAKNQKQTEALAAALGLPMRESYFNESLGVMSSRPSANRNITQDQLMSRFESLPGYEQEKLLKNNPRLFSDTEKRLAMFQNEREKNILSQLSKFTEDLSSGRIFHQKNSNGNYELMTMGDDPNATEEDRLLGKIKKVPIPISLGQKSLFIEAMRRKALPAGMESFAIEGLNNGPNLQDSKSPISQTAQVAPNVAASLASARNSTTLEPSLQAQNPMGTSNILATVTPSPMELSQTPWQNLKAKLSRPIYTNDMAVRDLSAAAKIGVEGTFDTGVGILNRMGEGVQGIKNFFSAPSGNPEQYTPIPRFEQFEKLWR